MKTKICKIKSITGTIFTDLITLVKVDLGVLLTGTQVEVAFDFGIDIRKVKFKATFKSENEAFTITYFAKEVSQEQREADLIKLKQAVDKDLGYWKKKVETAIAGLDYQERIVEIKKKYL